MAAAIRLSQQHSCSLPDASRAPDRKDSTPRHGRLLHPSSRAERDDRDHAAENFFQGGSPKTGHPISPPGPPSAPEIVLRRISGDGAWMKIRNQKVPPTRGAHIEVRRQDKMRLASRLAPPPHAAHPPGRLQPILRSRCAPCSRSFLYNCAKKAYNLYSRRRAGKVYPHEIDIQETHPGQRSQAAMPLRTQLIVH